MSQGDIGYVCLLPKVASSTGSLRCSSEFNSSTPACPLGVSYSKSQASLEDRQFGWVGSPVSGSFLHHGWAQRRCFCCTWESFIWNMLGWEEWNLISDPAGKAVAFTFFWHGLCSSPVGNWAPCHWVCIGVTQGHFSCHPWCKQLVSWTLNLLAPYCFLVTEAEASRLSVKKLAVKGQCCELVSASWESILESSAFFFFFFLMYLVVTQLELTQQFPAPTIYSGSV